MKIKKILNLSLFFIILMVIFNERVWAANDLKCVYYNTDKTAIDNSLSLYKIELIQEKSGNKKIFISYDGLSNDDTPDVFGKDGSYYDLKYYPPTSNSWEYYSAIIFKNNAEIEISVDFTELNEGYYKDTNLISCPLWLNYYNDDVSDALLFSFTVNKSNNYSKQIGLISSESNAIINPDESEKEPEKTQPNTYDEPDYENICTEDAGVNRVIKVIGTIILISRILVPILIIVLGIMDFTKAATSSDEKAVNKASKALIRRIVAGVCVFIAPTILKYIIINVNTIINGNSDNVINSCTKCVFEPFKCEYGSGGSSSNSNKKPSLNPDYEYFQ